MSQRIFSVVIVSAIVLISSYLYPYVESQAERLPFEDNWSFGDRLSQMTSYEKSVYERDLVHRLESHSETSNVFELAAYYRHFYFLNIRIGDTISGSYYANQHTSCLINSIKSNTNLAPSERRHLLYYLFIFNVEQGLDKALLLSIESLKNILKPQDEFVLQTVIQTLCQSNRGDVARNLFKEINKSSSMAISKHLVSSC